MDTILKILLWIPVGVLIFWLYLIPEKVRTQEKIKKWSTIYLIILIAQAILATFVYN